jgi:hypothetical protein
MLDLKSRTLPASPPPTRGFFFASRLRNRLVQLFQEP